MIHNLDNIKLSLRIKIKYNKKELKMFMEYEIKR